MAGQEKYVLVCVSTHDVTKAESRLRKANLWCDMIPMPREIASECGMALMFDAAEVDAVVSLCRSASVRWEGVFAQRAGSYTLLALPESTGPKQEGD